MKYRVRLTAEVSDVLETFVEVEAASEEAAHVAALALTAAEGNDMVWECAYEGERDPVEVDSVTLIPDEGPEVIGAADPVMAKLREILTDIQAHDRSLDDPHGDGSGNDAESPTGDDYNDLCGIVQPLFDMLGLRGPLSNS